MAEQRRQTVEAFLRRQSIADNFDLAAHNPERWQDYTPIQLWRTGLEWLKMTSDPVYLESPLLGRNMRSYCLGALLIMMAYNFVHRDEWAPHLQNGLGICCVALCLLLHFLRRPILSDMMLCASILSGVMFMTQVLAALILCQSHPLSVALAALLVCWQEGYDPSCDPGGYYCPSLWHKLTVMCLWSVLAVGAYCADYTARVRFIVDGAVVDWQAPLESPASPASRHGQLRRDLFRWVRWSTHPAFLASPVAGRTCRRASLLAAASPLWRLWLLLRCQRFASEAELPGEHKSAVESLAFDVAVAAGALLLPGALVAVCWRRSLLSDPITSDMLLGISVVVSWALVLFQCFPLGHATPEQTNEKYAYALLQVLNARDMTVVGLVLSGIHPAINCQVYLACLALARLSPLMAEVLPGALQNTQVLAMVLLCCAQIGSYWWRLIVIKRGMNRAQANAMAHTQIQTRTQSKNSNAGARTLRMSHTPELQAFSDGGQSIELEAMGGVGAAPRSYVSGCVGERCATRSRLSSIDDHLRRQSLSGSPSQPAARHWYPTIAVVRHAERADHCFESDWPSSTDSLKYPFDPPITEKGVEQAREIAMKLKESGEFHVVVSSPYLRCVQTGLIIAERLNCALLVDGDAGEVFGPKTFGDVSCFESRDGSRDHRAVKPWRSMRALRKAAYSNPDGHSLSDLRVFWGRTLGSNPQWPESLHQARLRYTRCFLKYMRRAWKTKRNFVVVSHEYMVQACLSVLPASSSLQVDRINYCSGLLAWLHCSAPACLFAAEDEQDEEEGIARKTLRKTLSDGMTLRSARRADTVEQGPVGHFYEAGVQWWEVALLGVDEAIEDLRMRKAYQVLQSKCLQELGPCWQDVKQMLGGLPEITRRTPSDASTREGIRCSFSSSTYSGARTIVSSEASTMIFGKLGQDDYKQTLVKTEAGVVDTRRASSSSTRRASTCSTRRASTSSGFESSPLSRLAGPQLRPADEEEQKTGFTLSVTISPALAQRRPGDAVRPLRRLTDVCPGEPPRPRAASGSGGRSPKEFTISSSLAKRRAATKESISLP